MAENKTTLGVQFYKGWYGKGTSKNLPTAEGAIIFNEEEQIIYVNGKPYGGASDVNFNEGILTFSFVDGRDSIILDFNDTASANATLKVFERIDNLIGKNVSIENGDGKLNYTDTNYLTEETTLVGADRALDAKMGVLTDGKTYENEQISTEAKTALNAGAIDADSDTLGDAIKKVDGKIDAVVDEILKNEKTVATTMSQIKSTLGAEEDMTINFTDAKNDDVKKADDVKEAIIALDSAIDTLDTASTLHLKKVNGDTEEDAETVSADGSEYKLYQGTNVVAKFNIEKDSFVREGEVVRGSLSEGIFSVSETGEYFIHLTIKTTDDTKETDLYIPAESLVDAYKAKNKHTEGDSATEVDNNVTISIDNTNNTISAVIKAAGVGTNELADGAVTFAKIAADNVQDGEESSTLLTTKTYVDETISAEVAELDATVTNDSAETQTETVKVTVTEEDGKLTSVSTNVLGAGVKYTSAQAATEDKDAVEANLEASENKGAVLGSDIEEIKSYIDAKSAKGTTVVNADSDETINVESTIASDGHTEYTVSLVWKEWGVNNK